MHSERFSIRSPSPRVSEWRDVRQSGGDEMFSNVVPNSTHRWILPFLNDNSGFEELWSEGPSVVTFSAPLLTGGQSHCWRKYYLNILTASINIKLKVKVLCYRVKPEC